MLPHLPLHIPFLLSFRIHNADSVKWSVNNFFREGRQASGKNLKFYDVLIPKVFHTRVETYASEI